MLVQEDPEKVENSHVGHCHPDVNNHVTGFSDSTDYEDDDVDETENGKKESESGGDVH